ncbi:hypothetical protein UMZ34_17950 [Halopseudomonas pachastrellae]|nr:hypothetical protein UMZ34_17950 [Halopseudomonas pachastrellae]
MLLKLHQRVRIRAPQGTRKGCINLAAQGVALFNQSRSLGAQPAKESSRTTPAAAITGRNLRQGGAAILTA